MSALRLKLTVAMAFVGGPAGEYGALVDVALVGILACGDACRLPDYGDVVHRVTKED